MHVLQMFLDVQGDIMYAEVARRDADEVRGAVEEGGVYLFSKFLVVTMKPSYNLFAVNI